ncbi:MAG: bifunctional riboflavin kinase/FAD synthetase [Verrucomicrobiales bacterium]|nr:bifunctional riboflavin kinase/FAD synthetase [Verrucomicrobiales bacterium]
MIVVHSPEELPAPRRKVCLAIGVFDGVHLGHQAIIRHTVTSARARDALALVLTFDRHPNAVVAPDRVPPMIYTPGQKQRALAALGVDVLWLMTFDEATSRLSGEVFVRRLAQQVGELVAVCVGADFVFGHRRSGNVALLQQLGAELGFEVAALSPVLLDGVAVSSTRIREAIRRGDLAEANRLLGRDHALAGTVVRGAGLGRKLGFPTANLDTRGLLLPPNGVYAARVRLGEQLWPAVVNIGVRPTVDSGPAAPRVETHLLDFEGDLTGRELELILGARLRDEQKFSSLEALRAQIARDIARVRAILQKAS